METPDLLKSKLEIDETTSSQLLDTAKWARFMAIVGFVICGLTVVFGLFFSTIMNLFTRNIYSSNVLDGLGMGVAAIYILLALLLFIPNLLLYRFATKMKTALSSIDQLTLNEALGYHRRFYKFIGILTIILLVFYALIFLVLIVANIFR